MATSKGTESKIEKERTNGKKATGKAQDAENPIANTLENIKQENAELKSTVQQMQYQMQILITRLNRLESFQTEMDVYLRNHKHQDQEMRLQSA